MKTHKLVLFSILLALEALFCFTPLGSLPAVGPIVATLAMLPVIVTSISLGTRAGSLMGFFAGLFSLIVWTFMPPALSAPFAFVFSPFYSFGPIRGNWGSLVICFVPRILAGTVSGLVLHGRSGDNVGSKTRLALSGFLGSMTNTTGVILGIWLFFADSYASLAGQALPIILGTTVLFSGIPEGVLGGLTASLLGIVLSKGAHKYR